MLPDPIHTRNMSAASGIPIRKVSNVITLCEIMNDMPMGKGMLSQVDRLLSIFYTIPITTSITERTFLALRRLKTFLLCLNLDSITIASLCS